MKAKAKKTLTKLEAYKQVVNDIEFAKSELEDLLEESKDIGRVEITTNLDIYINSSEKQFLFAIGVLKSNIDACKELGVDPTDLREKFDSVKELFQLSKEISQWQEYVKELDSYHNEVKRLLTDDDKFALLEYPSKK
jgi:hypothetical protein